MSELTGFAAVERPKNLTQSAYLRIQQAIRDRTLTHGKLYSVNEIATALGMSRTPVREAMITLAREGLVDIVAQRGFRLRELSTAQRNEIFDLRILLETYVAQHLAESASESEITKLRELITRQKQLSEESQAEAFLAVDEELHLLMPRLLGLERTHGTLSTLRGAMWLIGFEALSLPERAPAVVAEHQAIVEAIAVHDPDAAARAVREHITKTATATRSS